jgi:hypothetical protein
MSHDFHLFNMFNHDWGYYLAANIKKDELSKYEKYLGKIKKY